MPNGAQNTSDDAPALPPAEAATDADVPPLGRDVADTWAEAADEIGTVKSTKQVPEPDSRGG